MSAIITVAVATNTSTMINFAASLKTPYDNNRANQVSTITLSQNQCAMK